MTIIKRPFRIKNADGSWNEHYFRTSEDMIVNAVQNLSGTGYRKLPGGLILQWGTYTTSAGGQYINGTFPVKFNESVYAFVACVHYSGGESLFSKATPQALSTSDFIIYTRNVRTGVPPTETGRINYIVLGK